MNEAAPPILVAEDNPDDVFALRRALHKAQIDNPVHYVTDGRQTIEYLAGTGAFSEREKFPPPFLLFLDLKMPHRDGFEVLAWLRDQPALAGIAVVILTGSDETKDHVRAYALGARSYLVKPPQPADLQQIVASLRSFWSRRETGDPLRMRGERAS